MDEDIVKARVRVKGTVQGVGFRPFVYGLAIRYGLSGFVRNDGGDVYIEVEGDRGVIGQFVEALTREAPPLSRVREVIVDSRVSGPRSPTQRGFVVVESRRETGSEPGISPDAAICENCRRELLSPQDRRYLYPFINCTDCGPRFTIVEGIPYDRQRTTMRSFEMCAQCSMEYLDPSNRRFHAEPNACGICGPKTWVEPSGHRGDPSGQDRTLWIREAQAALRRGEILAVKGIGGFHLACDALNSHAVVELRFRKHRPARPFAVMVDSLETAEKWFAMCPEERSLLVSRRAPIVILERRDGCPIVPEVAPGLRHIGIMLPYSPLDLLLFQPLDSCAPPPRALVMTSGNATGMPLSYLNAEAKRDLREIADRFILHDRHIARPCDDSVVRVVLGKPLLYRRSRGYVPEDFEIAFLKGEGREHPDVLGAGAEGKNTFCFLRGNRARLSQHVGDLGNEESLGRYKALVLDLAKLYNFFPDALAVDMHPGYGVSRAIRELYPDVPAYEIQHHHAHMAQVMAEHGISSPCVGLILDGTGYGVDGKVWGGEVLYGDCRSFERIGHFGEVTMPCGDKAVLEPWRMAVSYLKAVFGDEGAAIAQRRFPDQRGRLDAVFKVADWREYPITSSAGRLFDAVSAIVGLSSVSTYDGESASLLGEAALSFANTAPKDVVAAWPLDVGPDNVSMGGEIDTLGLFAWITREVLAGAPAGRLAFEFHRRLAAMLVAFASRAAQGRGTEYLVLSGGVFQNPLFLSMVVDYAVRAGLTPLWPVEFPPNDGGISLGQAVIARQIACDAGSSTGA